MKKIFVILIFISSATLLAVPNAQIMTDSAVPLPKEETPRPQVYLKRMNKIPLEPDTAPLIIVKPAPIPLVSPQTAIITTPAPIPLTAPDDPTVLPSTTVPIQQYASKTLYEALTPNNYRVIKMKLNDFAVTMARKAGLNYIYNPDVRGIVNGNFRNTDPIYMLHMAAKANGYKTTIRNGIFLELEPEVPKKMNPPSQTTPTSGRVVPVKSPKMPPTPGNPVPNIPDDTPE